LAEVDYDTYAEGEAVLGWLNAAYELRAARETDWKAFAARLMDSLSRAFDAVPATVGHVKLALSSGGALLTANLVGTRETLEVHGDTPRGKAADLTLNARAQMSPELLGEIVRAKMAETCGAEIGATAAAFRCLSPGYPRPTHRYKNVVG